MIQNVINSVSSHSGVDYRIPEKHFEIHVFAFVCDSICYINIHRNKKPLRVNRKKDHKYPLLILLKVKMTRIILSLLSLYGCMEHWKVNMPLGICEIFILE